MFGARSGAFVMLDNLRLLADAPWLVVQALFDGIMVGALFALVAYGMALVWGVMKIINIVQGELVIIGGYIAYYLYDAGIHPLWGLPVAGVLLFALGWLLYETVIRRVVDRDVFVSILATFGLSILLQQLMNQFFGADVRLANAGFGTLTFTSGLALPVIRIIGFVACALFAVLIVLFMRGTRTGMAIRATAQNARAAGIVGIRTHTAYAFTYALNAAICGVAGALIAMTFTIHPYIGLPYTVRSFMIVVMAGLGNLPGVILAGTGLGFAEQMADYVLGTEFRLAFIFSLLVVTLVVRNRRLARMRTRLE